MLSSTRSIMDQHPDRESFYRNLSLLATAALAVHVSWTYDSPGDCDSLAGWLASAMPTILSGLILLGTFFVTADDIASIQPTRFFSLTETSPHSGPEGERIRTSGNPDREDRHLFYVQVVAFAVGLGVSIDLIDGWYRLCQAAWAAYAKSQPHSLLILVTVLLLNLGVLLLMTWMPIFGLLQTKQDLGGRLPTEGSEERARLRTLIAAAEAYEEDLRSQMEPSHSKVQVVGEFLDRLRKWQSSRH
ncbi:hypothetical protein HO173_001729 [Letharia columbiana]|uniref:Uncharacterized protein n=1 Tax=Letharia columbiana TaxID=112416 RepID=A0A8H6L8Y1_9LECA|nr:uncharacterized protein HO173_001729 [Letharia columbiana]KAF6240119.1 hypothetical protein HO173_001729 [Letharia columbiana]